MKYAYLFAAAALLTNTSAIAQELVPLAQMPAGKYVLDKTHASLTWKVNHMGLSNYTARFTKLDANLNLDPQDPTKSTLIATVDPASVRTDYVGEKDFDAKLAKDADWFNAGQFPEIKFESTKIEKTGDNTGKITGNLTFLGVTRPLTLDTKFNGGYLQKPYSQGAGIGFSATASLKRSEWGMKTYVPMIGDEVSLLIEVEFDQANPPTAAKK